jgi:hypothetical protein
LTGFQNMVTMVCCVFAIFTIDRYGRRKALVVGAVGQSICFWLLGALSKVAADGGSKSVGEAAGSFIFIFNVRMTPSESARRYTTHIYCV